MKPHYMWDKEGERWCTEATEQGWQHICEKILNCTLQSITGFDGMHSDSMSRHSCFKTTEDSFPNATKLWPQKDHLVPEKLKTPSVISLELSG